MSHDYIPLESEEPLILVYDHLMHRKGTRMLTQSPEIDPSSKSQADKFQLSASEAKCKELHISFSMTKRAFREANNYQKQTFGKIIDVVSHA